MVFAPLAKSSDRKILDVGCGLGGTAHYIQQQGWGTVVGFDIEQEAIDYARKHYPDIEFMISDVIDVHTGLNNRQFDVLCLFNVFYAFSDQSRALQALHKVTFTQALRTLECRRH